MATINCFNLNRTLCLQFSPVLFLETPVRQQHVHGLTVQEEQEVETPVLSALSYLNFPAFVEGELPVDKNSLQGDLSTETVTI